MKYETKDLEIFILSNNREKYIAETIESILNQTVKGFDVIVLDNGSTDNTPQIVLKYNNQGIQLNRLEKNIGVYENIKRAQNLASKKLVMIFHDDDLMHPEYIKTVLECFNKYPETSLVGSNHDNFTDNNLTTEYFTLLKTAYLCNSARDFATLLFSMFPFHFGSAVYQTNLFKKEIITDKYYGKVFDRPFMLEISKNAPVIALKDKFIKYRIHESQDSNAGTEPIYLINLMKNYRELIENGINDNYARYFKFKVYEYYFLFYQWGKINNISFSEFQELAIINKSISKESVYLGILLKNQFIQRLLRKFPNLLNLSLNFQEINLF